MKILALSLSAIVALAACDVKVANPPADTNTTIVNPPGEKKVENNTTIVKPAAEEKKESTTTVTGAGGTSTTEKTTETK